MRKYYNKTLDRVEITYNIPGGWYGNDPGWSEINKKVGVVIINPKYLATAIPWLQKIAYINETKIKDDGILIDYRLK
jgi:hypothetical protein